MKYKIQDMVTSSENTKETWDAGKRVNKDTEPYARFSTRMSNGAMEI